ncbi:hypothetical protein C8R47DRAFT_1198055 [Mycena vitilis]|nr:hypothetical protein C8R47DRAFT_1198055 [Mycena vitilis]
MVRDLCDTEIGKSNVRIFYQSTHRDIIAEIELATLTSVAPLLGAHHSFKFLTPKHVGDTNHTSVIYEYNYERFNSPERTNWTTQLATYTYLPPDFAIKNESVGFAYPTPSPSDAKRPQSAKPLPGRLILGHPDCLPDIPAPLPPPPQAAPAQPTEPVNASPPQIQPEVTTPQRPPDIGENTAPEAAHPPPRIPQSSQPPEPDPPSEFAFAPYEPPLHFPRARSPGMPPAATAPQPSSFANKRDPYEEGMYIRACWPQEEEQGLLKEAPLAAEPDECVVKLEVKKEKVKEEEVSRPLSLMQEMYAQVQEMNARNAESTGATEEEGAEDREQLKVTPTEPTVPEPQAREPSNLLAEDLDMKPSRIDPPVKSEEAVKQEQDRFKTEDVYVPSQELQDLYAQGQQVRHERLAVKPEPSDAPMPRAPPRNKRFDPFNGYELEAGSSGASDTVKREGEARESQTRQPYMPHASSPTIFPVKREENASRPEFIYPANVKQEFGQGHYTGRDLRPYPYSPVVKHEDYDGGGYSNRGAAQPPQNLSYREVSASPSSRSYPPNNISSGGHRDASGYPRERSTTRTYSPPPRPVKRERDSYENAHASASPGGPPVKGEQSSVPIYTSTTPSSTTSNSSPKPNLSDPRVRARIGLSCND